MKTKKPVIDFDLVPVNPADKIRKKGLGPGKKYGSGKIILDPVGKLKNQ